MTTANPYSQYAPGTQYISALWGAFDGARAVAVRAYFAGTTDAEIEAWAALEDTRAAAEAGQRIAAIKYEWVDAGEFAAARAAGFRAAAGDMAGGK